VLAACDAVRDVSLPKLGVRLEDLSGGGSRWKLDDPQVRAESEKDDWVKERVRERPNQERERESLSRGT
jgi:hypothetical protein